MPSAVSRTPESSRGSDAYAPPGTRSGRPRRPRGCRTQTSRPRRSSAGEALTGGGTGATGTGPPQSRPSQPRPLRRARQAPQPGGLRGAGSRARSERKHPPRRGTTRGPTPADGAGGAGTSRPTVAPAPPGTRGLPSARRVPPFVARRSSCRPPALCTRTGRADPAHSHHSGSAQSRPPSFDRAQDGPEPRRRARQPQPSNSRNSCSTNRGSPSPSRRPAACAQKVSK